MTRYTKLLLAGLAGSLLGCGGHAAGPGMGEEKGGCYPNATCNQGLTCFSNLCVRYSESENSGDGATGIHQPGTMGTVELMDARTPAPSDAPPDTSLLDGSKKDASIE